MIKSNNPTNLLRHAKSLIVVDDGAYKWVADRGAVLAWLHDRGKRPTYHTEYNLPNHVTLTGEEYESMCDSTVCLLDTAGGYGPPNVDAAALIRLVTDAGADFLYVG